MRSKGATPSKIQMSKFIPISPTVTLTVSLSVLVNMLRLLFEGAGRGLHSPKYSTVKGQIPLHYSACELFADQLASQLASWIAWWNLALTGQVERSNVVLVWFTRKTIEGPQCPMCGVNCRRGFSLEKERGLRWDAGNFEICILKFWNLENACYKCNSCLTLVNVQS